ncbi:hypothetical protein EUTSA_v10022028mg [Eutrema salsugineum]|uniref:Ethylene-responsive binding factor-associated repression domain-containing protein n=1 Tax=Eutrema salsugineum TaxID=72664 RepID=V4NRL8_EUTSA|nr:hypothetical protein EUTSA_v10022028mg [Eutrema salsugineum]
MATKLGKDDEVQVELELCLSLGGPFKKTEKAKPIEFRTDGNYNAVRCAKDIGFDLNGGTRKRREAQRSGEEEAECKRIRTVCNGILDGVDHGVNLDLSFRKMGNNYGSGQFKENCKPVTIGSPICSSPDVSDPSSSSRHEAHGEEARCRQK